jgi:hypothetical protein
MSQLRVNTVTDVSGTGSTYAPGHVVQVVQTVKTNTFTTTAAGFVPVTGLSATITPKYASSKILVLAQISYGLPNDAKMTAIRLYGADTASYVGDISGSRIRAIMGGYNFVNNSLTVLSGSINYLSSPNSTAPQTIGVEVTAEGSTAYINRSAADDFDNSARARAASSITLMEIAQ